MENRQEMGITAKKEPKWTTRRIIIFILAFAMAFFHIYTAGLRPLPGVQQRTIHLSFALALTFLTIPFNAKRDRSVDKKATDEFRPLSLIDLFFLLLSIFPGTYIFLEWESLSFRSGNPNFLDSVCSFLGVFLVLEATRRVIGWSFVIICLVGFVYLAFGTYLPSPLTHAGFSFEQAINFMFLSPDGILGLPLGVSATVIIVFLIFGSFLLASGAGSFFIDVGLSAFGKYRGGPAKASILGSCMFGMITGSQVANVGAVGVLTIPLMKRVGYKPIVAASVEALSSTGGMLVPPVMGATAFIIPEIIGGTYLDVCKAALIPGLLFYVSVYMIVELQSAKYKLLGLPRVELPSFGKTFLDRGHMVLPVLVLVFCVVGIGMTTTRAGFWAIIACVVTSQFRSGTRMNVWKIVSAMERGSKGIIIVAICCASAGLITGVISQSGLGTRFSDIMIAFAGGNVFFLLFMTMIASLILGLPLPPVTCYLILAVLAAPALIKLGIIPIAAHLFIFFFGTLASISPPAAPTSFAAAALAETDPVKTTNLTFLYCLPSFIVPYLYIYANELLLIGSIHMIIVRILCAFIGISCMAVTFHGYLFRDMSWIERVLFMIGGLAIIYPNVISIVIGLILLIVMLLLQKNWGRKKVATA